MANSYSLGIDVGSTTVKTVIADISKNIIYSRYQRHFSKVRETVAEQLILIRDAFPTRNFPYVLQARQVLDLQIPQNFPLCRRFTQRFLR